MASTWTKAAIVRRKFKAGRQRQTDLVLTPTRAVLEGYILLHELQKAMVEAGLPEEDVHAALVLITPGVPGGVDKIYVLPFPDMNRLPELYGKVRKLHDAAGVVPLGIVVSQTDRETQDPKSTGAVWVQPWLTGTRAARALLKARQVCANGGEGESKFN